MNETVIVTDNVSYGGCRRLKVSCILYDNPMKKEIVRLLNEYKRKNDVVFVFFYKDDFDFEHGNAYAHARFARVGKNKVPFPWKPIRMIKKYAYSYNPQYNAMRDALTEYEG